MSEERRNELLALASRLESEVKTVVETTTGSAAQMHDTAKAMAENCLNRQHGSWFGRVGFHAGLARRALGRRRGRGIQHLD
jgi:hypothetical protein